MTNRYLTLNASLEGRCCTREPQNIRARYSTFEDLRSRGEWQGAMVLLTRGEAADIVRDSRAGMIVEPGQINKLVEALRVLRDRPDLRREFGENRRRAAEQHFDCGIIANQFIDHLEASV
jgi:hypothetical protein